MIVYSISLIAVVIIVLLYRKSLLNLLIRIFALLFLVLLTTNFVLPVKKPSENDSPVFLVDASLSMKPVFSQLLKTIDDVEFPHRLYFFSESLCSRKPARLGSYTNITAALRKVKEKNPAVIFLFSDGNHNYGRSPIDVLDEPGPVVYTFGVGVETIKDIAVADVVVPKFVYINDTTKIEVIVQSAGYKKKKGIVEIELPSGKLRSSFPLSLVGAQRRVVFKTVFKKPGEKNLVIKIRPESREQTYENNIFYTSLNVLSEKIRVQYFTSHPSFNTKFILDALNKDSHIALSSIITLGSGRYLDVKTNRRIKSHIEFDSVDVVILDNINFDDISISDVRVFLKQGKGMLIIGSLEGVDSVWQNILPINMTGGVIRGEYRLDILQPFSVFKPGDEVPPISAINRVYGSKDDAVVIARSANLPIIAYHKYGGIVFQINIVDLGTWQFLQKGLQQKDILAALLSDIIRFTYILKGKGRLFLEAVKKDYRAGEEIRVKLQSFDSSLKPASGGDFYLKFGNLKIPFYEVEKGMYEATFFARNPGKYKIYAQGRLGDEILKSRPLNIEIRPHPLETTEPINHRLLQMIAKKTMGKYYPVDSLKNLKAPRIKRRDTYTRIKFNHPIFAVLIILLFSFDWILRRRRGGI